MEGRTWKRGRTAFAVTLLLLLIFSAFVFFDDSTEEADAILPISMQFNFASTERGKTGNMIEIKTGPPQTDQDQTVKDTPGQVQVKGTLEVYRSARLARTKIFVDLFARAEHPEFSCSILPPMIDIEPTMKWNSTEVTVNLQISPATRFSTNAGSLVNVTVWGVWRAKYQDNDDAPFASGEVPEYPLYVNVRPYHFLDVTFTPVMLDLTPGSSGWVTCRVKNQGNGFDRVELSIPGEIAFAKSGWAFEFESTVVDLEPNAEAFTRVKITAPREISFWYIQRMYDIPVLAVSYYSEYMVKDGDLLVPYEYNTGMFVQVEGISFVYVPWMWAMAIYLAMALVLFNLGINPLVMKKRKIREPGFVKLYNFATNPERRARAKARRDEKRKFRREERGQRRAEKEKLKEVSKKERKPPGSEKERVRMVDEPVKKKAPVLDLKRTDDDFDIEIPALKEKKETKPERRSKSLLGGGRKRDKVEKDMIDVLGSLDD